MLLSIANNLAGSERVGGEAVCAHPVTDPVSGNHILFSFCLQLGFVACTFLLFGWKMTIWLPGLVTRLSIREFNEVGLRHFQALLAFMTSNQSNIYIRQLIVSPVLALQKLPQSCVYVHGSLKH